jgi:hypothetical protein
MIGMIATTVVLVVSPSLNADGRRAAQRRSRKPDRIGDEHGLGRRNKPVSWPSPRSPFGKPAREIVSLTHWRPRKAVEAASPGRTLALRTKGGRLTGAT